MCELKYILNQFYYFICCKNSVHCPICDRWFEDRVTYNYHLKRNHNYIFSFSKSDIPPQNNYKDDEKPLIKRNTNPRVME